jgi:Zn-dependent metalloprotease
MNSRVVSVARRSLVCVGLLGAAAFVAPGCSTDDVPADIEGSSPDMEAAIMLSHDHLIATRVDMGLDTDHAFRMTNSLVDELDWKHIRYQQTYRGVRVWGGDVIAHVKPSREVSVTSDLKREINIDVAPAIDAKQARLVAHNHLSPKGPYVKEPDTELVVFPITKQRVRADRLRGADGELNAVDMETIVDRYTLAYHVHTLLENGAEETDHVDYMIDAHSGDVLATWSTLYTVAATGTASTQYNGVTSINTDNVSGTYQLSDTVRSMNFKTYNLNHATTGTGSIYTDADNTWGDGTNYAEGTSTTNAAGQTAGVDAHFGIAMTFDYYKNIHGRNGIDNTGKATYSRMHYSNSYDNAFWDDTCFCMTYGDGSSFTTLTSIDVAGHEMTHGVTSRTANLTYSGESGGLNEAMSDIHGTMVEFYSRGGSSTTIGSTGGNWTIGEQLSTTPLRYMYKPSKDGASKDAWSSTIGSLDVHYSSGPMNRAFYFLSQGASATSTSDFYSSYLPGGMTGLGNDKAAKIAYSALASYMTSSTNYAGARTAFLSAASALYGSAGAEYAAVQNAFAAINVGSAAPPAGSGDTTAPTTSITAPAAGATLTGTVTLSANASDNVGVSKVDFYAGTTLLGTDTTSPYSLSWNSAGLANGAYSFTSKATDAAGNVGTSAGVSATVSNAGGTIVELLLNNGFETGTTPWTQTAGVIDSATSPAAYAGTFKAWMCGYGTAQTDYIYQTVTIPSTATKATLSYYLRITTAETGTTAYDTMKAQIRSNAGAVLKTLATYSNANASATYALKTFDVTAYKGQTIQVYFTGTEDSALATSFLVDNVSLTKQ